MRPRKKAPPRVAEFRAALAVAGVELAELAPRGQLGLPGVAAEYEDADDSDECYTPQAYLDVAELLLEGIDTDPCWHPHSLVRPRRNGWSKTDDGLVRPWEGGVWFQPPYSDPLPWVRRLLAELDDQGRPEPVTRAVAMMKLDPSTQWWHELAAGARAVCVLDHRVRFLGPFAKGKPARFCSAMFALGEIELERCRRVYSGGAWYDPRA